MFQFLRTSVQFIACLCHLHDVNVGLARKPSAIAGHLKNWSFVIEMLAADFISPPY